MTEKKAKARDEAPLESGTGAQCPEAQADGVPCDELGHDCEDCGHAVPRDSRGPAWRPPKTR